MVSYHNVSYRIVSHPNRLSRGPLQQWHGELPWCHLFRWHVGRGAPWNIPSRYEGALQTYDLIPHPCAYLTLPSLPSSPLLTFSPLISFRCSWRLRLTSRMRLPWSRMTLILSASERRSLRTRSSLVHLSSSSSLRPEMSSAGLSVFAIDSWSWGWGGGVAFSIGTARQSAQDSQRLVGNLLRAGGRRTRWRNAGR